MRPKLVSLVLAAPLALAAPVVAHAQQATPSAVAPGGAEPPQATLMIGAEQPASPSPPAPAEEPSSDLETENEERLSAEAEALVGAEEAAALDRIEHEAAAGEAEPLGNGGTFANLPCLVPSLKGDTLRAARRALSKAHCRLGRVTEPRRRRAELVVTAQARRAGARLADEAPVGVRLGGARQRRVG